MNLVEALDAESSTVAVVGAGGKKTTIYALAARLDRAVVTSTVRIPIFDTSVERVAVTEDPVEAVTGLDRSAFPVGVVPERERSDRYRGFDPSTVDRLSGAHDGTVLVKADGARFREFKAPGENEPRIPDGADVVVPVVSVHAVGRPLTDQWVHRPERVARITGRSRGEELTAADVATVVASDEGGLKNVPDGASVVPLLTKVDGEADREAAETVAGEIHDRASVPRVVFARFDAVAVR